MHSLPPSRNHPRSIVALGAALALSTLCLAQSEQIIRFDAGRDDTASAITTDATGAIIVAGSSDSATGSARFTVVKHDAGGSLQWSSHYQGAPGEVGAAARAVATDSAGNIYAAGHVMRQVTALTTNIDWLVVSFDPNGRQRWAHVYNGPAGGFDQAMAMALDPAGALLVTGISGIGNDLDWLTTKYALDGAVLWQRAQAGAGAGFDQPVAIATGTAGSVHVLGSTSNLGVGLAHDLTLVKYDAAGTVLWVRTFSDTPVSDEFPSGLALDANDNSYVTGTVVETTGFESAHEPFTLKYDSVGTLQFAVKRETAGGFSVAIGPDGNPVVAGTAIGAASTFVRPSVAKLAAATGAQLWATPLETEGEVAIDFDGSIYVGGFRFLGTASSFDFFATRLAAGGQQIWQRIVTAGDIASDAHLDGDGNFFVTGTGVGVRNDMVTVRFSEDFVPPPPPPPPAVPAAPSALGLTAAKGRLTLRWTDNASNETGFRIERAINGGAFVEIAQAGANVASFTNTGLNKKNTYAYRVRAFNASGASDFSNTATGRPN